MPAERKPGSVACSFAKLRSSTPAPTSSVTASAVCAITNPQRRRERW
jgi:hypothetical protein